MKKIIAILLLIQIISNNAFGEELIKLPRLITHYVHHAQQHADARNFYYFLHTHYSDHHHDDVHAGKQHEEDKDCSMPFKHCSNCCINLHHPVAGFMSFFFTTDMVAYPLKKSKSLVADDRIESLDLCSIWQPPKIS